MSNMICVEKSKPSAVKRLKFLPRFGFVVDVAGREITYRQAPVLETLLNLSKKGLSMKNFMEVAFQQLSEINLKRQPSLEETCGPKKRSARRK